MVYTAVLNPLVAIKCSVPGFHLIRVVCYSWTIYRSLLSSTNLRIWERNVEVASMFYNASSLHRLVVLEPNPRLPTRDCFEMKCQRLAYSVMRRFIASMLVAVTSNLRSLFTRLETIILSPLLPPFLHILIPQQHQIKPTIYQNDRFRYLISPAGKLNSSDLLFCPF